MNFKIILAAALAAVALNGCIAVGTVPVAEFRTYEPVASARTYVYPVESDRTYVYPAESDTFYYYRY